MTDAVTIRTLARTFNAQLNKVKQEFVNRDEAIDLIGLAMICREHVLLLGPPGTAKTSLIERLRGIFDDASHFSYLLTRFTEPTELFGPMDLGRFTEEHVYRLNTKGMLPEAHIAFLDEVFQGSSAILNALLTLINERRYHDGSQLRQANLLTLLGSSNEIPDDPLLAAFSDRFLLRCRLDYVPDDAVADLLGKGWVGERALIRADRPTGRLAADLDSRSRTYESFTLEDIHTLQQAVAEISVAAVRDPLAKVIRALRAEGINFSDRRAVKAQRVIAAHALLHDRASATVEDLSVLAHLWADPHDERSLRQVLSSNDVPLSEDLQPVKDLADIRRDLSDLRVRANGRLDYTQEYKDLLRELNLMAIELQRGHPGASTDLNAVRDLQQSLLERAREQFEWDADYLKEG